MRRFRFDIGCQRKPRPALAKKVSEGRVFDNVAPSTSSPRNIADRIIEKVETGQTERIILNLDDSEVSLDNFREQLTNYLIDGLKELIIIKDNAL